jgi:DNA-binding NarL/FixJ family response regulator
VISVLLVEDHAVVRAGLAQLLGGADGIEVVGAAADGAEAVALAQALSPDVILMDLSMPVMDGIEATRRICEQNPEARVVVLTSLTDRPRILGALDAGAMGYLLKDAEPGALYSGIHAAAQGDAPIDPRAARELLSDRNGDRAGLGLTERERAVLTLVGGGLPNKLIATRLGISEKTVKAHLTNVFRAIGVTDRTQAALWAQRHGLISADTAA